MRTNPFLIDPKPLNAMPERRRGPYASRSPRGLRFDAIDVSAGLAVSAMLAMVAGVGWVAIQVLAWGVGAVA